MEKFERPQDVEPEVPSTNNGSANGVNQESGMPSGQAPFGWDVESNGAYDHNGNGWVGGTP